MDKVWLQTYLEFWALITTFKKMIFVFNMCNAHDSFKPTNQVSYMQCT